MPSKGRRQYNNIAWKASRSPRELLYGGREPLARDSVLIGLEFPELVETVEQFRGHQNQKDDVGGEDEIAHVDAAVIVVWRGSRPRRVPPFLAKTQVVSAQLKRNPMATAGDIWHLQ